MKKGIGWVLLFLSALSMTMCSKSGPEMNAFVMSPSGAWLWLVWLALLIGGAVLTVKSNPPSE